MKLLRFRRDDQIGIAVETAPGTFYGLCQGDERYPGDLIDLVIAGPEAMRAAGAALASGAEVDVNAIAYLPPLGLTGKIICIGLNYVEHSEESGFVPPNYPTVFARFASSLIGHKQPMIRPRQSDQLDFEGELVAVIGRGGRNIPKASALDHVAGYSVFNDGSVRDFQNMTPQWTIGKNFDGTGAFGPVFVAAGALPAGAEGLKLETRLNGEVVQSASTSDMIFSVAHLVSLLSEAFTLEPGDIIVTGTPAGVGMVRNPPLFMKPGDICEVQIEGIGTLVSPIVQG